MVAESPASTWLQPDLGVPGIRVVSTTRQGGSSEGRYAGLNLGDHVSDDAECVDQNRAILEAFLPSKRTITWLKQVHGTRVLNAASEYAPSIEGDAIWTDNKAFACTVMTADCLPIVLADIHGRCIAAVHGGWRGLASHILRETIEALPVAPEELVAWLGPAIGPTAFEVGGDVLAAFYLAETDAAVRPVSGVEEQIPSRSQYDRGPPAPRSGASCRKYLRWRNLHILKPRSFLLPSTRWGHRPNGNGYLFRVTPYFE